jgi:hypothetical protein
MTNMATEEVTWELEFARYDPTLFKLCSQVVFRWFEDSTCDCIRHELP